MCLCRESMTMMNHCAGLGNVDRVEVLPYHTLGVYKWEQLGIPYTLAEVSSPDEESLIHVRRILTGQ